jgi:hypothetical protein
VALDRFDDAPQDRVKGLALKGPEEVTDREIVGHPVFRYVGDHDFHVLASVLMSPRVKTDASDLGQVWGDFDADDTAEGPFCGLMDNAAFPASEVNKGVAIGDPEVTERAGQHMPG